MSGDKEEDEQPGDVPDADKTRIAAVDAPPVQVAKPDEDAEKTRLMTSPPELGPLPLPRSAGTITKPARAIDVGTMINNNYRIEEVLKAGGMGAVYRGVEIGTGDPVAIKSILPELAEDEKAGLLFKREARTLRQLADDAVVRYYNYVHDRDLDCYFLVMEFIDGVPLSEYLEQHGALPVPAVMTLLKRLCRGLSKAHAKGVVHRDLSPDNVMLPHADVSEARLIDFGIAKSNVVSEGTMHGQFAGKFKYVAPEQLGHHDGHITPATDVYGLALMMAAAALGKPLPLGGSIVEAVTSRQAIPDLSNLPQELRPILAHMLEPDPANRPTSTQAVQMMLENPVLIPAQYRAGLPLPPAVEATERATLPPQQPMTPPPGLQVPFATQSRTPLPTTPPSALPLPAEEPPEKSGTRALGLLVGAFVVISAAVALLAWEMGMLGDAETSGDRPPEDAVTSVAQGIPPPQRNTRAGFLADFQSGPCTLLARIGAGQNAGMIEGFSQTGDAFPGLPTVYEEQFGARPEVLPRRITAPQCAALAFTRAVQGRGREAPRLHMSTDKMVSGQSVTLQIGGTGDAPLWAGLVTPDGAVFNLTERLSDPVGGQRTLGFGLTLADGSDAVPQLVLVIASDSPLARMATAQDGMQADALFPLVLEEIAERGGAASASLGYVLLAPEADE